MDVEWAPARERSAARVWEQVLRPVAAQLQEDAAELAGRVNHVSRAALTELIDDEAFVENAASTEATLRVLARGLDRAEDPARLDVPSVTLAFARTEAQRRVALIRVSQVYRIAHQEIWRWFAAAIPAHTRTERELAQAMALASDWLFAFIAASTAAVEEVFAAEQDVWTRSLSAKRAEAIADILQGGELDSARAEARLRHPMLRDHLAIIAWTEVAEARGAEESLETVLAAVVAALGAGSHLPYVVGLRAAAVWVSRTGRLDRAAVAASLASLALPGQVRLALGGPGSGLAGFRRSYLEAGQARRIASMLGETGDRITWYDDVAVESLASVDLEQAVVFVERVLGRLAEADEASVRAAETVTVYLAEGGHRSRTAERLGLHPNTVRYRLSQAEILLGRSLDGDVRDLQVALALLPVVGRRSPR